MTDDNRKLGRRKFGPYRLLSLKSPGIPWEGLFWIKAKSKAQIEGMSKEEIDEAILTTCPFGVPSMCFPAGGYPLVRHECKKIPKDHELHGEDRNCVFLVRYANIVEYGCRLLEKTDKKSVYSQEY